MNTAKKSWRTTCAGTGFLVAAGLALAACGAQPPQPVEEEATVEVRAGNNDVSANNAAEEEPVTCDGQGLADVSDPEALYWCGAARYFAGEVEPAREIFTRLAASYDRGEVASAHHYLAMLSLLEGKVDEAVSHYEIAGQGDDTPVGLYYPGEIWEILDRGQDINSGAYGSGTEAVRANWEQYVAEEILQDAVEEHNAYLQDVSQGMQPLLPACRLGDLRHSDPDGKLAAMYHEAAGKYFSGDIEGAVGIFSELAEEDACDLFTRTAHQYLGVLALREGDIEQAKEHFQVAYSIGGYIGNEVAGLGDLTREIVPALLDDNPANDPSDSEIAEAVKLHLEYLSGPQNTE